MRTAAISVAILLFAIIGNSVAIVRVSLEREALRENEKPGLVIPSPLARVVALEFNGILSDIIFSRTMTYFGGKIIRQEELTDEEWRWIYENIELATDLDPYFFDPYYFGAMALAWEANKVREANLLLEKAMRYRDWDWTLFFYLGFNHFYFLQDNEKAAFYLMEGAKLPGGSGGLLPTLAARLSYEGKRTENAIIFLQEILDKTEKENVRWIYERRLNALRSILFLERAVIDYQNRFKEQPSKLEDLVARDVIKEIPGDPYNGEFYIDKNGSIKTTSELR